MLAERVDAFLPAEVSVAMLHALFRQADKESHTSVVLVRSIQSLVSLLLRALLPP